MSTIDIYDEREIYRVYRVFDANGALLYVGVTGNLPARTSQHRGRFGHDITVRASVAMNGLCAAQYEISLILRLNPPHNREHTSRDRRHIGRRRILAGAS